MKRALPRIANDPQNPKAGTKVDLLNIAEINSREQGLDNRPWTNQLEGKGPRGAEKAKCHLAIVKFERRI
jgi:hypothetical protein